MDEDQIQLCACFAAELRHGPRVLSNSSYFNLRSRPVYCAKLGITRKLPKAELTEDSSIQGSTSNYICQARRVRPPDMLPLLLGASHTESLAVLWQSLSCLDLWGRQSLCRLSDRSNRNAGRKLEGASTCGWNLGVRKAIPAGRTPTQCNSTKTIYLARRSRSNELDQITSMSHMALGSH